MRTIDYKTLKQKIDMEDDFLLINALPKDEFKKGYIEGSVNIPIADKDFVQQVERRAGAKDHEIVVYCGGGGSTASRAAAESLQKTGFSNVHLYEGGMKEWTKHEKAMAA
jgi:rhodanese-related sulfurtransferase